LPARAHQSVAIVTLPVRHPATNQPSGNVISVNPGESLRLPSIKQLPLGLGMAKAGQHTIPATLKIPSGVTLSGEGLGTVDFPRSKIRRARSHGECVDDLHTSPICDLVVECAAYPIQAPTEQRTFVPGWLQAAELSFSGSTKGN
jgi:hypothetical protein